MKYLIFISAFFILIVSCTKDKTDPNNNSGVNNLSDTIITDVPYGIHSQQKYDIHLPSGRDKNTPIILMIHGGAWKAGKKEDLNYFVNLVKSYWSDVAIVNMNYRLASNTNNIHHNEIMNDIKAVIGKVIANQNTYNTSSNMGLFGTSAGGQLAMIYAYRYNDYNNINCIANIFGPSIISDWSWYNSTNIWLGGYVGNILAEYVGQSWDTTLYNSVSPYWNINLNSQPTITFHGSLDPIVPVYQSQWLHSKLNNLNVTNEYHEYLSFHELDNNQSHDAVSKMVPFFQNHIK